MAEAPPDPRGLETFLECAICLDQFDNPRRLNCDHHFCKGCLEDILQFNDDDNNDDDDDDDDDMGTIKCPKCNVQTSIDMNKTVNDLPLAYELKGMLEFLKSKETGRDPGKFKCSDVNCFKVVSVYCCGQLMCNSCIIKHDKSDGEHLHNDISISRKEDMLKVVCKTHLSNCTHLCHDGVFLCSYCIHRSKSHVSHSKATVEQDVELLKETLVNDLKEKERILQYQRSTEENMKSIEKKFDDILDEREEECLSCYKEFLKKEKDALRSKLKTTFNSHMEQYSHNMPENYHEEAMRKHDIVLAIEKRSILNTLGINRISLPLKSDVISVSPEFGFLNEHPLGEINISPREEVSIWEPPMSTLKENFTLSVKEDNISAGDHCKSDNLQPDGAGSLPPARRKFEEGIKGDDDDRHRKHASKLTEQLQESSVINSSSQDTHPDTRSWSVASGVISGIINMFYSNGDVSSNDSVQPRPDTRTKPQPDASVIVSEIKTDVTSNDSVQSQLDTIFMSQSGVSDIIIGKIKMNPVSNMVQTYFDIEIGKIFAGRLVMDLYYNEVPNTSENFVQLCCHTQGFGYKGSNFHFISQSDGYCGGGDITKGDGSRGRTIYGEKFACENFEGKHNGKGLLTMYN